LWGTISSILYRPGQVQYLPITALLPIPTCAERDQTAPKMFSDVCCHGQFCMDLHSAVLKAECKPAKLTGVQQSYRECIETLGVPAKVFRSQMHLARSTSSAHTAVDDRNTTCTISTLALLKLTH